VTVTVTLMPQIKPCHYQCSRVSSKKVLSTRETKHTPQHIKQLLFYIEFGVRGSEKKIH
jgi:hypothetical protein